MNHPALWLDIIVVLFAALAGAAYGLRLAQRGVRL